MLARIVSCNNNSEINTFSYEGKEYVIKHANKKKRILSVVDSHGRIVKSIHRYLSYIIEAEGLSVSENTIKHYAYVLTYLIRWIEKEKPYGDSGIEHALQNMNRNDVKNCIVYMRDKTNAKSSKTLHNREAVIKDLFKWMESKESGNIRNCKMSPWENGNDLAVPNIVTASSKVLPKMITKEMIIILLNGFYNECERCMYHTQYDTGMRIQEVIDITRGELPDEKLYPKGTAFFPLLVNGVKGRGGNKKPRGTLISRAVLRRIRSYHNSIEYMMAPGWKMNDMNKPVFLTSNNSKWKYRNSAKQFERAVNRSCLTEKFTTHWLRHGTAYSVLGSNMHENIDDRLLVVQQMLGHESIKTTGVYVNMNPALILDSFVGSDRLLDAEQIRNETFISGSKSVNKKCLL